MIHQHIFASPRPGMTEADFLDYWINVHAVRYACKIPQIRAYCIDAPVPFSGETSPRPCGGVAEIWLENEEEQLASLQSDEFLDGARPDEPTWAAFWRTFAVDTTAHELLPGKAGGVKLLLLVKRRPGMSVDAFRTLALGACARALLKVPGLNRYVQCHTRDGLYAVGEALLDAVHHLWFDDAAAAESALRSPHYAQAQAALREIVDPAHVHALLVRETWIIGPSPRRASPAARLLDAVRRGDHVAARVALEEGAPPDAREAPGGLAALMVAAGRGDAAMVELLLGAGADPRASDPRAGATALHKACQGGSAAAARLLVEAGAALDAQVAMTGHTPLLEAIWFKEPEVVRYLVGQGAGLNITTHYGFSLQEHLDYALRANNLGRERLEEIRRLVAERRNADQAAANRQALMAAVTLGDAEGARSALAAGAAVDERAPIVNGFNDAHTPLLVAARDGHTDIVRLLLDSGADVNATEPTFGAVPLHKAVYNGHAEITRMLTMHPGVNLDFQGATNGYTPLLDAIWHGYEGCATILIEAGARLDLVGHDGMTPIELARKVFGPGHALVARLGSKAR